MAAPTLDEDRMATVMRALASPVRLRILRMLRDPLTLRQLRLQPHRAEGGVRPARPMTAANVRQHVAQLAAIGAVRARRIERDGRASDHYEVNRPHLFALTEELRSLAELPGGLAMDGTLPVPPSPGPPRPRGPHLVLVRGLGEGRSFPLGALAAGRAGWTIGRGREADVSLEYDGFVSAENSRIVPEGGGFAVEDVPTSRNGTAVNWQPLPRGGRARLQAGDVVGVGRSLLLFRA
jgi:DNA-binding transcriptional ArsR family regulator